MNGEDRQITNALQAMADEAAAPRLNIGAAWRAGQRRRRNAVAASVVGATGVVAAATLAPLGAASGTAHHPIIPGAPRQPLPTARPVAPAHTRPRTPSARATTPPLPPTARATAAKAAAPRSTAQPATPAQPPTAQPPFPEAVAAPAAAHPAAPRAVAGPPTAQPAAPRAVAAAPTAQSR